MNYPSHLNLELTTRCTMGCPLCARTLYRGSYEPNDLSVSFLKTSLAQFEADQLKTVFLIGNLGDPIFHPQFHSILDVLLENSSAKIVLNTSASGRNRKWWRDVATRLRGRGVVVFSIDGTPELNAIYRKGAQWSLIADAIEALRSDVTIIWKMIAFKYNVQVIEEVKKIAHELGFSKLIIEKSDRWNPSEYPAPALGEMKDMDPGSNWRTGLPDRWDVPFDSTYPILDRLVIPLKEAP